MRRRRRHAVPGTGTLSGGPEPADGRTTEKIGMAATSGHISLTEAADRLGVHYMTAYRYVRTGRLPGLKDGHEWQVDPADVEALNRSPSTPGRAQATRRTESGRTHRPDYARRLVERLLHADEAGAWTLMEMALTGGMDARQIYLELLSPALVIIGDRWAAGEITIAQEHQCSAIVVRLIGRMGPRFARRGRRRGTILVGAPPCDTHGIPSALMSDLLRGLSFEVVDLGADVPADSWASAAAGIGRLIAVGLCATTSGNGRGITSAIEAVRSVATAPIVLGGAAIAGVEEATALGAAHFSGSFEDALSIIEQLATGRAA
jgi:excisionase family DNA binding protein